MGGGGGAMVRATIRAAGAAGILAAFVLVCVVQMHGPAVEDLQKVVVIPSSPLAAGVVVGGQHLIVPSSAGAVTHTIIQQPQPVVHVVHESSPVMRAAVLRLSKQNAQLSGEVRSLKALVMQIRSKLLTANAQPRP